MPEDENSPLLGQHGLHQEQQVDLQRLLKPRGHLPDLRWALLALASVAAGLGFFAILGLMSPGIFAGDFGGDPKRPPVSPTQHLAVKCSMRLVESIPEGLVYNSSGVVHLSTYEVRVATAGLEWLRRQKGVAFGRRGRGFSHESRHRWSSPAATGRSAEKMWANSTSRTGKGRTSTRGWRKVSGLRANKQVLGSIVHCVYFLFY